jgi:hypothetical protein
MGTRLGAGVHELYHALELDDGDAHCEDVWVRLLDTKAKKRGKIQLAAGMQSCGPSSPAPPPASRRLLPTRRRTRHRAHQHQPTPAALRARRLNAPFGSVAVFFSIRLSLSHSNTCRVLVIPTG